MSKSANLQREYESMGKRYPGDRAAAKQQLRLARECRERALALDPTLRKTAALPVIATDSAATMALDAAIEEAIIERAIRTARKSSATRTTSRKVTSMPKSRGLPARVHNSLFQLGPDDQGYQSEPGRTHALDADPSKAEGSVRSALVRLRGETSEDDIKAAIAHLDDALEALKGDAEDEDDPDAEFDNEGRAIPTGRAKTGGSDRRRAKDGVGEVPARSVASSRGADSALPDFDADTLFQRGRTR